MSTPTPDNQKISGCPTDVSVGKVLSATSSRALGKVSRNLTSKNNKLQNSNPDQPMIILDSGATDHVCSDKRLFQWIAYRDPKRIIVGNGESLIVTRGGPITMKNENGVLIRMNNALYCPEFDTNVISVSQMARGAGRSSPTIR